MKNLYLIFIILLLIGEISLSQNPIALKIDDLPSIGQVQYVYHDTSHSFPLAITSEAAKNGENQLWDFSGLIVHTIDTIQFLDPLTSNYDSIFSNSTIAAVSSMYDKTFFINTSTNQYQIDGIVDNTSNAILKYLEPLIIMNYPSTYLDSFTNQSIIVRQSVYKQYVVINDTNYFADSVKKVITTQLSSVIDGYGTLMENNGSISALRQYITINKDKETYFLVNGNWMLQKTESKASNKLRWWTNGYSYPIMECAYNPVNGMIRSVSFLKMDSLLTNVTFCIKANDIRIYPNPASTFIGFYGLCENCQVWIYNTTGSCILKTHLSANELMGIENWKSGMYLYYIVSTEGGLVKKGKFNIIQ